MQLPALDPVVKTQQHQPKLHLHPSFGKLKQKSFQRREVMSLIKRARHNAVSEYKTAQAQVANAHSVIMRYTLDITVS